MPGRGCPVPQHTLTVNSSPVAGVAIAGSKPGMTNYTTTCEHDETVTLAAPRNQQPSLDGGFANQVQLSAPASVSVGGVSFRFAHWLVNGAPQALRQTDLSLTMDADRAAEAVYLMANDADGNCLVNILDLIFVRNRLGKAPGTGDNWQADVNDDGLINILDLIAIRGKLGSKCPQ